MSRHTAQAAIRAYYEAFNAGDLAAMQATLHDDFAHHVNEGALRLGKQAFADFCQHMSETYRETLTDLVVFGSDDGTRGAAEFTVNGTYLKTDPGLPEAHGQSYVLPAGGFFTLKDGKITRVTTYYNLQEWIRQVSA
ncbi:ketosteroid isomerase-related protein [Pararhodobacter sp.]|uniref:ketosteroid isomerase-related protein n=1 Tax=Pararhodobacter sp. TaxID=2127056 RepID=UPI002B001E24|nr:ketosteroid isomerase-related protein [Pararhodobacter sp.]